MPPDSAPRRASNLLNQSHERLEKDLNVHAGDGLPSWKMQKNVQANDAHDEQSIWQAIEAWQDNELENDERASSADQSGLVRL
ncbi:MAG: hypothetical protein NTX73_07295 [Rhodobacterales bacterium]|nr:hypothetical protein [Rhodobacterales bacterium]